jgi:hypothetical protein
MHETGVVFTSHVVLAVPGSKAVSGPIVEVT